MRISVVAGNTWAMGVLKQSHGQVEGPALLRGMVSDRAGFAKESEYGW
jgi:hypothetical protein